MGPLNVRVTRAPGHVTIETTWADTRRTRTFSGFADDALSKCLAAAVAEDVLHFEASAVILTYEERGTLRRVA